MNEEGGAVYGVSSDANMDSGQDSRLPPIDDLRKMSQEKAAQRAREEQECQQFKTMTLEQKKKVLDAYVPQDYFTKGAYIDAQDTTNIFIMAKIICATPGDITVNFDGWSEKWDAVSGERGADLFLVPVPSLTH